MTFETKVLLISLIHRAHKSLDADERRATSRYKDKIITDANHDHIRVALKTKRRGLKWLGSN